MDLLFKVPYKYVHTHRCTHKHKMSEYIYIHINIYIYTRSENRKYLTAHLSIVCRYVYPNNNDIHM